jgi:WD40 repeat protein
LFQAKKKGGKRQSKGGGAASQGTTLLALGTHSGQVLVWDATDGRFLHRLGAENTGHSMAVTSAAFSAGGDRLYSSGQDRMIFEWDLATGNITQ